MHQFDYQLYLFDQVMYQLYLFDQVGEEFAVVAIMLASSIGRDEEVVDCTLRVVKIIHTKLQVLDSSRHLQGSTPDTSLYHTYHHPPSHPTTTAKSPLTLPPGAHLCWVSRLVALYESWDQFMWLQMLAHFNPRFYSICRTSLH